MYKGIFGPTYCALGPPVPLTMALAVSNIHRDRANHILNLVGGFNPSEKYDFVSWDDDIPNLWKHIKFHGSKPPNQQRFFHELDHPANGVPPWIGNPQLSP